MSMWCWSMIFSNVGLTLATIDIGGVTGIRSVAGDSGMTIAQVTMSRLSGEYPGIILA